MAKKKYTSKKLTEEENKIKEFEQRNKTFNGMTAHEWTMSSRSVWNDVSSARKGKHLLHGATYPEKLAERVIKMYSREGDSVLDPFLGTGTTVISALRNNRNGYGIELSPMYFELASTEIQNSIGLLTTASHRLFNGDCETMIDELDDQSIQLTFTSPPYADLIHKVVEDREKRHKHSAFVEENNATTKVYSDSELDLGNMPMDVYKEKVTRIMVKLFNKTKPGGYNIWVVKDFRDIKNKIPYVDLHSAIAECGSKAGFVYHDLIIWDQNEQRALVLLGYPSVFYVNQNHSHLVVLRRPLNEHRRNKKN